VSDAASISADGRYVAFSSLVSDLVPGDGNGVTDVFVRDLLAGVTIRASVDRDRGDPGEASGLPPIDPSGRFVAFYSLARDLVPGPGDKFGDVYVARLD
jgi:hypothetical protein